MDTYNTFKPYEYVGTTLNGGERLNDDAKYCVCECSHYKIFWYSRHSHLKTQKHKTYIISLNKTN
jgi:hypothetical protein